MIHSPDLGKRETRIEESKNDQADDLWGTPRTDYSKVQAKKNHQTQPQDQNCAQPVDGFGSVGSTSVATSCMQLLS